MKTDCQLANGCLLTTLHNVACEWKKCGSYKPPLPLDIEAVLAAVIATLAKAIKQEQNDMLNGRLCDLHDEADALHDEYVEAAHDEPEEPMGKKVPMDFNG